MAVAQQAREDRASRSSSDRDHAIDGDAGGLGRSRRRRRGRTSARRNGTSALERSGSRRIATTSSRLSRSMSGAEGSTAGLITASAARPTSCRGLRYPRTVPPAGHAQGLARGSRFGARRTARSIAEVRDHSATGARTAMHRRRHRCGRLRSPATPYVPRARIGALANRRQRLPRPASGDDERGAIAPASRASGAEIDGRLAARPTAPSGPSRERQPATAHLAWRSGFRFDRRCSPRRQRYRRARGRERSRRPVRRRTRPRSPRLGSRLGRCAR